MKSVFAEKLAAAIEEVTAAEKALGSVLRQIRVVPRAEKTTISEAVELAFMRLKSARRELIELQKLAKRVSD
jgi:hypothetical protein